MTTPLGLSDGLIARIVASAHMVGNEFVVVPYCIYPELAIAFARHVKSVWCLCPSKEDTEWLQSPSTPKNVEAVHADVPDPVAERGSPSRPSAQEVNGTRGAPFRSSGAHDACVPAADRC